MSAGDRDASLRGVPRRFRRAVHAVMRVSFRRCACELIVAGPRPSVCPELLTPSSWSSSPRCAPNAHAVAWVTALRRLVRHPF